MHPRCSSFASWLLAWVVLSAGPLLAAAQPSAEGGARAVGLGGATTALFGDAWGHTNPAAWASLPGRAVSFFGSEAFGLPELRLGAVRYVEPTRFGSVALGARSFGFDAYRETGFQIGYARGLHVGTSRRFLAGLNARYHRVAIDGYGHAGAVGVSLGGLVRVMPSVSVGFSALNLNRPRLAGRDELPRAMALGLGYRPGPGALLLVDAYKDVDFPLAVRAGLEVHPVPVLALRAGVATEPVRFTLGTGLRAGRVVADVAAERHEALGWSPAFSFGLQW